MIKNFLEQLKMKGALAAYAQNEGCNQEQLLFMLLSSEIEYRQNQANKRKMLQAKFPIEKEWSDIDKRVNPDIDFNNLEKLDMDFIKKKQNLCLMGQPGTGKTHSLIALGRKLCRQGISTKFYTACTLVNALQEAKASHNLSKFMPSVLKPQLLIIDELGYIPFSEDGARLLFEVFSNRHERGSIAISTNLPFDQWTQIFGSVALSAALIDRFTHRCNIYTFKGKSIRFAEAQAARKRENKY
jgi:DNA replication protein DnaC